MGFERQRMPHANKRMRMLALDAVNAPTSYSFATFAPGISAPFYLTLTLITNRRILNYNPVNRGQISAMVVFGGGCPEENVRSLLKADSHRTPDTTQTGPSCLVLRAV